MVNIACTIKNITLVTITNGSMYRGGIDKDGMELSHIQMTTTEESNSRIYYCDNCNKMFDGTQTFEEVKKHFGTFPVDNIQQPFYD